MTDRLRIDSRNLDMKHIEIQVTHRHASHLRVVTRRHRRQLRCDFRGASCEVPAGGLERA